MARGHRGRGSGASLVRRQDPSQLRRLQMGLVGLELDILKEHPEIWVTPDTLMRRGLDALWADLGDEEKGRVED